MGISKAPLLLLAFLPKATKKGQGFILSSFVLRSGVPSFSIFGPTPDRMFRFSGSLEHSLGRWFTYPPKLGSARDREARTKI